MIKIDLKGKEYKSGKIQVQGSIECSGPSEILEAEIYGILKTFERDVRDPYGKALDRIFEEIEEEGGILE